MDSRYIEPTPRGSILPDILSGTGVSLLRESLLRLSTGGIDVGAFGSRAGDTVGSIGNVLEGSLRSREGSKADVVRTDPHGFSNGENGSGEALDGNAHGFVAFAFRVGRVLDDEGVEPSVSPQALWSCRPRNSSVLSSSPPLLSLEAPT